MTDTNGVGVVRERYWLTFAPGEIRSCTSCHGINQQDQAGHPAPTNTPLALISLLNYWKSNSTPQMNVVPAGGGNSLQVSFVRRPAETGVTYHAQASTDLRAWTEIATYSGTNIFLGPNTVELSRTGSPNETITLREAPVAPAARARFLRLKVTRP